MCYAFPGPRCSDHTRAHREEIMRQLEKDPSNVELQERYALATEEWYKSPEGIEHLLQEAKDEPDPQRADDLRAKADANQALRAEALAKYNELHTPDTAAETPEERIKRFNNELEEGVEALKTDEGWQRYLDAMSKFHRYSWNNQILIALQRPDATLVAGFNRWKDVDRSVKKGEKGITILAPKTARIPVLDNNGEPVTDENGKRQYRKVVRGFTTATVFDISQTEGKPLNSHSRPLTSAPPPGLSDDIKSAIRANGYTVREEAVIASGADGYTLNHNGVKEVVVRASLPEGQKVKVLAHELGHIAMGHMEEDRAGEYHTGHGGQRGTMEVEAEGYAYVLCRANGMDARDAQQGTTGYIGGWSMAQDGAAADTKTVKAAAESIAKAVGKTLSEHSWSNAVSDPIVDAPRKVRPARRRKTATSARKKGASAQRSLSAVNTARLAGA